MTYLLFLSFLNLCLNICTSNVCVCVLGMPHTHVHEYGSLFSATNEVTHFQKVFQILVLFCCGVFVSIDVLAFFCVQHQ